MIAPAIARLVAEELTGKKTFSPIDNWRFDVNQEECDTKRGNGFGIRFFFL